MNFWVALGAGFFAQEGLDVELVVGGSARAFLHGAADVAVMPRPTYLRLVGQERPILAFANLLRHDPINLVVRREVVEALGLSANMPLTQRVNGIRGLRVGIAPGPRPRLRLLLESVGLDAESDIEMVIVPGEEQNQAFEEGRVDALYAHTPYLEKAVVDQDAVIVVNQSSGQVPGLANRQIHMLVTTQSYAGANPEVLAAMATAVYRAQQLIHRDRAATIDVIHASGVELRAPQALETIVGLYAPAIPQTPEVSIDGAMRELALFPGHRRAPDLSGVDMTLHVDNRFAEQAVADER